MAAHEDLARLIDLAAIKVDQNDPERRRQLLDRMLQAQARIAERKKH